jgi:hypothetical protein
LKKNISPKKSIIYKDVFEKLENTEGAIKNGQSRETGNKMKKNKTKTQCNGEAVNSNFLVYNSTGPGIKPMIVCSLVTTPSRSSVFMDENHKK